jgi:hypothetical protein
MIRGEGRNTPFGFGKMVRHLCAPRPELPQIDLSALLDSAVPVIVSVYQTVGGGTEE